MTYHPLRWVIGNFDLFSQIPNEISTKVHHAQSSSLRILSTPLGISLNEFQKLIFVYICACVMKFLKTLLGTPLKNIKC
jgi:hypothetical protein